MPVLLNNMSRQASLRLWHQLREALEAARSGELRPCCRQTCSGATFLFSHWNGYVREQLLYSAKRIEIPVFPSLALEERNTLDATSFSGLHCPTHLGEGKRTCRHLCCSMPLFSWRREEKKIESLSVGIASVHHRKKF